MKLEPAKITGTHDELRRLLSFAIIGIDSVIANKETPIHNYESLKAERNQISEMFGDVLISPKP